MTSSINIDRITHAWNTDTSWSWDNPWVTVSGYYLVNGIKRVYVSAITIHPTVTCYCNSISLEIPVGWSIPGGCRAIFSDTEIMPNNLIGDYGAAPKKSDGTYFPDSAWSAETDNVYFDIDVNKQLVADTQYYVYIFPKNTNHITNTSSGAPFGYCIWGTQPPGISVSMDYSPLYVLDVNYSVNGEQAGYVSGNTASGTFDAVINGNKVADGVYDLNYSATAGSSYTITANPAAGWTCLNSPATGVFPEADFSVVLDFRSLYTITYSRGSYGLGDDMQNGIQTHGQAFTLASTTYTRPGYKQIGWSTSTDGSTKDYDLGQTFAAGAGFSNDIVLYPCWEALATAYVKSDGSFKGGTPYVKVNGTWTRSIGCYVKVDGKWQLSTY